MSKRNRRSPEEMLKARLEDVKRLEAASALARAKSNPKLTPIVEALEENEKALLEAKKGFGKGPQSFSIRLQAHDLWIAEITAQQQLASAQAVNGDAAKHVGASVLEEASALIANGNEKQVTKKFVTECVQRIQSANGNIEGVEDLEQAVETTKAARIAFNTAKKAPKRGFKVAPANDNIEGEES